MARTVIGSTAQPGVQRCAPRSNRRSRNLKLRLLAGAAILQACSEPPVGPSPHEDTPAFVTAGTYSMYEIPVLSGFTHSEATGINDAGTVIVGTAHRFSDQGKRAFRWSLGGLTDLGVLPGHTSSEAFDANDSGLIVGVSWPAAPAGGHAFVYVPGVGMLSIHPQTIAEWTQAYAISNTGVVVGTAKLWSGVYRAFRWTWSKGFELLPSPSSESEAWAVNDSGTIVGYAYRGGSAAFLWQADGTGRWLGVDGPAYAINNHGVIVGSGYMLAWQSRDGYQAIPVYGDAISDKGRVVGFLSEEGAATWYQGHTTILPALHPLYGSGAKDVSSCGKIVGWGKKPSPYNATGKRALVWYRPDCD